MTTAAADLHERRSNRVKHTGHSAVATKVCSESASQVKDFSIRSHVTSWYDPRVQRKRRNAAAAVASVVFPSEVSGFAVWVFGVGEELPAEKDIAQLAQACIGVLRFRIWGLVCGGRP